MFPRSGWSDPPASRSGSFRSTTRSGWPRKPTSIWLRSRRRAATGLQAHGLRQVQVRVRAQGQESRKNQAQTVIKEIKLRPRIDPHDYGTKKGHVERFLKAGTRSKVTIMFRGREQSRPELGFRLLQRLAGDVDELGFVEAQPEAGRPEHDHGDRPAPPEERCQGRPSRAPAGRALPPRAPGAFSADRAGPADPARPGPARSRRSPSRPSPRRSRPSPAQPQAQPVQAQPQAQPEPVQAQPAQAQPAQVKPAAPRPAAPRPTAARPTPPPADRAPARPVPGPRAVHAAAAAVARRAANASRGPSSQARKSRPTDRTPAQRLTQRVPGAGLVRPGTGTGTGTGTTTCPGTPGHAQMRRRRRPCRR